MFRFVTIIPFEFWAYILLLVLMWASFGLNGLILTTLGLMVLQAGRFAGR